MKRNKNPPVSHSVDKSLQSVVLYKFNAQLKMYTYKTSPKKCPDDMRIKQTDVHKWGDALDPLSLLSYKSVRGYTRLMTKS